MSWEYLGDHGYVNEEADDAADGCNHLSPQGPQDWFRGEHVHDSCYQTLHPDKLKRTQCQVLTRVDEWE